MKSNHNFLYLSLSTLFLLSSCANEDIQDVSSESTKQEFIIIASQDNFNNPASRTQVDKWYDGTGEVGSKAGFAINWTTGDQIGVFGTTGRQQNPFSNQSFTCDVPLDNPYMGEFSGTLSGSNIVITDAYYPYNADNNNLKSIPVVLDNVQEYAKGSKNPIVDYDYKAAVNINKSLSWKKTYTFETNFEQMTTLLRFVIDKAAITRWLQSKNLSFSGELTSITLAYKPLITQNAPYLTGRFTYDLSNIGVGLTPEKNQVSDKLIIKPTTPDKEIVDGMEYEVAYAIVAPSSIENHLQLSFKYGVHTITLATEPLVKLERGKVYSIGITSGSLKDATWVSDSEPEALSQLTDGNEFGKGGSVF